MDAQPGKMVYSRTHRLIRDRENLLLTMIPDGEHKIYQIKADEEVVMLPMGTFHFEEVEEISKDPGRTIFVDPKKLEYPLSIRKWEKGDYFYPFGMEGKKKLSKFFKDEKLSLPQKENCWLLCSGEKIIWVIGHRFDARFAIDDDTHTILRISYTP